MPDAARLLPACLVHGVSRPWPLERGIREVRWPQLPHALAQAGGRRFCRRSQHASGRPRTRPRSFPCTRYCSSRRAKSRMRRSGTGRSHPGRPAGQAPFRETPVPVSRWSILDCRSRRIRSEQRPLVARTPTVSSAPEPVRLSPGAGRVEDDAVEPGPQAGPAPLGETAVDGGPAWTEYRRDCRHARPMRAMKTRPLPTGEMASAREGAWAPSEWHRIPSHP